MIILVEVSNFIKRLYLVVDVVVVVAEFHTEHTEARTYII